MKLLVRGTVLLVPLLMTACVHNKDQAQVQVPLAPPIEDAPPPPPNNAPVNLPPPVVSKPEPVTPPPTQPEPQPPPPQKPQSHRRKQPKQTTPATTPTPAPTQPAEKPKEQASSGAPEVPAIGQLSTGDPSDLRQQTTDTIASTEKSLNGINRKLSDQEQKTSSQIREFLKQAKAALNSGDVDGAHTLSQKAKVLLEELTQ